MPLKVRPLGNVQTDAGKAGVVDVTPDSNVYGGEPAFVRANHVVAVFESRVENAVAPLQLADFPLRGESVTLRKQSIVVTGIPMSRCEIGRGIFQPIDKFEALRCTGRVG